METKGIGVVDVVVGAVGSTPATSEGRGWVFKMSEGGMKSIGGNTFERVNGKVNQRRSSSRWQFDKKGEKKVTQRRRARRQ